jgi:hypothetical protein
MNKLMIILNGKKGSQRTPLAKFVFVEYLNKKIGKKRFSLRKINKHLFIVDDFNNQEIVNIESPNDYLKNIQETYSVKIYDALEPIKQICINILDLDETQCYGKDEDLNSMTHISWEDVFEETRIKYSRKRRGTGEFKMASGFMTAREVLNIVENEIFRKIYKNSIAKALFSTIEKEKYELAIVTNSSYPNEISIGSELGAKTIRLMDNPKEIKKSDLDELPLGEYSFVLNNENLSFEEGAKILKPLVNQWFEQYKLI